MDNPYSPPETDSIPRLESKQADDIRAIAVGHRWLIVCCVAHIMVGLVSMYGWSPEQQGARLTALWMFVATMLISSLVSLYVAPRVFYPILGYLISIVTLIPCGGLFAMFIICRRASSKLEELGIPVGYFGSDSEEVEKRLLELKREGKLRGDER